MRETDKIVLLKVWGFVKKWNRWETFSSSKNEISKFHIWDPGNGESLEWRAYFSDPLEHKKPQETSRPPCRPMPPPSKPPRTIPAMPHPKCPKSHYASQTRRSKLRNRPQICNFFNECNYLTSTKPPSQSKRLRPEDKFNKEQTELPWPNNNIEERKVDQGFKTKCLYSPCMEWKLVKLHSLLASLSLDCSHTYPLRFCTNSGKFIK